MQGQIPNEEKSRRLHALEKIAAESRLSLLEREVTERPCREVLFETYSDGYAHGHTDDFLEVSVKSDAPLRSETRRVRLEHTDGKVCFGVLEENI